MSLFCYHHFKKVAQNKYNMYFSEIQQNKIHLSKVPEEYRIRPLCIEAIKKKQSNVFDYIPSDIVTDKFLFDVIGTGISLKNLVIIIPKQKLTHIFCSKLVRTNGMMLEFIPKKFHTDSLYYEALEDNVDAIQFIPDEVKDVEMCLYVCKINFDLIKYVPNSIKTPSFYEKLITSEPSNLNAILANNLIDKTFLTPEFYLKLVLANTNVFANVPDMYKTEEFCFDLLSTIKSNFHQMSNIHISKILNQMSLLLEANSMFENISNIYNEIKLLYMSLPENSKDKHFQKLQTPQSYISNSPNISTNGKKRIKLIPHSNKNGL